ncbi:unnamed protein product [Oikopleura dioica]|nr:unnamed protein product [Oikopleura dioica]
MTSRETRRARIEELYKVYEEEIETLAGNNVRLSKELRDSNVSLAEKDKLINALKNDNRALKLQLGKRTPVKLGKHMLETSSAEMEILQSTNYKLQEQIKALQRKLDLQEASLKFIEQQSDGTKDSSHSSSNPDYEQSSDSGFADRHYNHLNNNTKPIIESGPSDGAGRSEYANHGNGIADFINIGQQELICKENFHLTTEDINIIYEETLPAPDNVEFFIPNNMRTPKKKTDRIDVNYSPARLPKNIRTRAVPASQLGSSSTGGRIFQIARSGISSLHSMNPAYPNSKLQPFRRTSPMKLSRSSEIEPGQEKQIQYVSVASVASLSNSSIVTSSGTFPHSSIASNSFPVTSAKIESDRTFSEQ